MLCLSLSFILLLWVRIVHGRPFSLVQHVVIVCVYVVVVIVVVFIVVVVVMMVVIVVVVMMVIVVIIREILTIATTWNNLFNLQQYPPL